MKIKKIFEIELDEPSPHWLCAHNLAVALNSYCKGAEVNFKVQELARYPDYDGEKIEHITKSMIRKQDRELLERLGIPTGKEGDRPLDTICRDIEHKAFDFRVRALEERGYEYVPKEGWKCLSEEKKRARFDKEISELGNCIMGAGMCVGCGKVRGTMAIYGGVPCEECGYTPERLTQESIDEKKQFGKLDLFMVKLK